MAIMCSLQADLIHLGAKYSPCMRRDQGIEKGLNKDLDEERKSACCVRDDGSGCAQMSDSRCSVSIRIYGSVHGTVRPNCADSQAALIHIQMILHHQTP